MLHRASVPGRVLHLLLAGALAASVSLAPLPASALIDRGLGPIVEVIPMTTAGAEQVVTAGGWYDASDYESPDPLPVLYNVDTDEQVVLPLHSTILDYNDTWAVWDTGAHFLEVRDMKTGEKHFLVNVDAPGDAVISGDRLVGTTADGAIVAIDLRPSPAPTVSTQYLATSFGTGLVADGDWVAWMEAKVVGQSADRWDFKAWNVATGATVTLATDVQGPEGELSPSLQLSEPYVGWTASDGAHVYDLTTGQDRLVTPHADEFVLSGSYAVWTAPVVPGVVGPDDVYALDLASSGAAKVTVTSTQADEGTLQGDLGWAVFQTPDLQGNPGVVTAVDLATGIAVPVSDSGDPTALLMGVDGQRVSWTTAQGADPDTGLDVSTLYARILGLPGPDLTDRYFSTTSTATVSWPPVPSADAFEYTIGAGAIETTTATSLQVSGLVEAVPVTVRVRSVRGSMRSDWAVTVAVNAATSKLAMSTKTTTVNLGAAVSFSASLTYQDHGVTKPVIGALARLQSSADGVTWTDVDGTETTVTAGAFTLRATAPRTLRYRAIFDGDDGHSNAVSPVVIVAARASVGTPSFPSSVKRSRMTSTSGSLRPNLVVHARNSITVYCYHYESRRWVLRTKVTAVTSYDAVSSTSTYAARISLTRTGKWRLRATYKGSAAAATNSSGYRNVTVK